MSRRTQEGGYRPLTGIRVTLADWPAILATLAPLWEPIGPTVWLSRECRCQRLALVGVPAKRVDIVADYRLLDGTADPQSGILVEVGEKAGRFDGSVRTRLTVRAMRTGDLEGRYYADETGSCRVITTGSLHVEALDPGERTPHGVISLALSDETGAVVWTEDYARLRPELATDQDSARLLGWHATRYFTHLPWEEVQALADSWSPTPGCSLAQANREAERALYRLSRDLGWHKTTLRERRKLGLDSASWVASSTYDAAQARLGHPTGASEATLLAARSEDVVVVRRSWNAGEVS